jgi:hypothetical protein
MWGALDGFTLQNNAFDQRKEGKPVNMVIEYSILV